MTLRMRPALIAAVTAVALLTAGQALEGPRAAASAMADGTTELIGNSREGRPIVATYRGPSQPRAVLVVLGSMHGLETAGESVVRRLRRAGGLPEGVGLWLVPTMNPDGRGRQRENAAGVDLNRNFPGDWRAQGPRGGPKWSGPRPGSEPETRAMVAFIERIRPDALVSFHQPFGVVDLTHPRARPQARLLARDLGLPARVVRCSGPCRGTLTGYADGLGAIAITVELPSRPDTALERRAARAVMALAGRLGR